MKRARRFGSGNDGIWGGGKRGGNIPGVDQAGDEAQTAEREVDERVGGADAGFDPDCDLGEEDGEEGEEEVGGAHFVGGSGGGLGWVGGSVGFGEVGFRGGG